MHDAGKHAADHDRVGAGDHRLGHIAGITDTAVGDQRQAAVFQFVGDVGDRGDLRHAHTGDNACGADGTRPDVDLDGVRAGYT